jgi:hypothetical protein
MVISSLAVVLSIRITNSSPAVQILNFAQLTQTLHNPMSFEERLFYPSPPSTPTPEFTSSTLILPSISIGNVPQLAIDLLITTLELPLVGYMTSPFLVPCAGTLETATGLDQGGVACPLESMSSSKYPAANYPVTSLQYLVLTGFWIVFSP